MKKVLLNGLIILSIASFSISCKKKDKNEIPVVSATFTSNSGVITVTATDKDGGITKVELINADGKILKTITSSPYKFNYYNLTKAPCGKNTCTIKVYDDNGGVTEYPFTFKVIC